MALPDSAPSLPPSVEIPEFEGPLDLLLDEVRRQNVAIENIAMAPIVARFLEYVGSAAERSLNLDIEWLHMAATLIQWKSRSLLSRAVSEDAQKDDIRDELIRQLLAHRKRAADELDRRRALEESRFTRRSDSDETGSPEPAAEESDGGAFVSVWDLIQQARDLARWVEQHRDQRRSWRESFGVEQDETTVREMIVYLRQQLAQAQGTLDGLALLDRQATASRRSSLFLGMLEMARDQEIDIRQQEIFGEIWILRM